MAAGRKRIPREVIPALVLSTILWVSIIVAFGALVLLALRRRGRRRSTIAALIAIVVAIVAALIPARRQHNGSASMLIDRFMPEFDYFEHHETRVRASPAEVFRAIEEVRPDEIRLFTLLTSIRGIHRRNPDRRPLLEISKSGGFIELGRIPEQELVQGTVGQFWRMRAKRPDPPITDPASFAKPHDGFAKATINFLVLEDGDGSRLVTETRILCDEKAKKRFTPYWRLIYPGSALIRVMWLEAIRRKAEG